MALPWLFRKLFQNDGAGEKLNPDIVPTTVNGIAADASGNIAIKDTNIPNGPFLPLAGGTMTGKRINFPFGYITCRGESDATEFAISASHDGIGGPLIYLRSGDSAASPGDMVLLTRGADDVAGPALALEISGNLSWNGNPIYATANKGGSNTWYRRYADGFTIQGGAAKTNTTVTFPLPMTTTNYLSFITVGWSAQAASRNEGTEKMTTTSMNLTANNPGEKWSCCWMVVGY